MNRPSILFITTDEQHLNTVYRSDMPYQLPGLRGLMACSDVYEQAYSVSPVCLPARCTWMTGLLPHHSGCISNHFGASLPLSLPNLFTCLKQQGYSTSMHGKCHFIPCPYPATRRDLTQDYEPFIHYYQSLGMDHLDLQDDKNNSMWYFDHYSKEMEQKGLLKEYRERFHGLQKKGPAEYPHAKETHPDSWTGQKALDYLSHCCADHPHFMWVSFSGPHYPMDAPTDYENLIDMKKDIPRVWREDEWDDESKHGRMGYFGTGPCTEGCAGAKDKASRNYDEHYWTWWRRRYYANIVQIDSFIQQIIEKATAIWGENLCIIFTSDHGDMMGNHSLWGKNNVLYDDVLRVPLIIHRPGQTTRRTLSQRVSSVDVFPTILQMGGCMVPVDIDGKPLDELTSGAGREIILSACEGRLALIKGNMKLCVNSSGPDSRMYHELYDLRSDPDEFINLYYDPAYAAVIDEMEKWLNQEPWLLKTVFYNHNNDKPYWFNAGNGSGYAYNGLHPR